ncbi:ABC transporter permease [Conservatibacter flavescens]|uniref:Peptide ABC transporter permease n=1 Tax=Conservatibacter flavescens TaxID=28161 RepID=A0A2M8S070_9PAST|nr:ABC transporter permease subunit [Conservatibacter flavescens]PJG84551.1 peptide ABC transporter permease [Conservatibacter flavescens]
MIFSLARRLFLIVLTLFILSFVSYHILLRDPLNQELLTAHFHLGYFSYIRDVLQGNLGISYNGGESLLTLILTVLPPTVELCITAILLALLLGIPLGLIGAWNHQNILGKSIHAVSSLGLSVPVFWIAPLLLYFAALYHWEIAAVGQFNLLYEIKTVTGFALIDVWFMEQPYRIKVIQNVLQHLILPTLVLMISPTMEMTRLVQQRAEFLMRENFVKVAATRGWSKFKIMRKLVLRNTLPLIVPQFPRIFTLVMAHCMLIENVFGWPGIGRWLIDALAQEDYNAISASIMVIGLLIIAVNQLSDLVAFLFDPLHRKGWYAR